MLTKSKGWEDEIEVSSVHQWILDTAGYCIFCIICIIIIYNICIIQLVKTATESAQPVRELNIRECYSLIL